MCLDEGVCHTATDDEGVALIEEVVNDVQFVCHFCATKDCNEGTDRFFNCATKELKFLFNEETTDCNLCISILDDACGGCVCAVCCAKCVVDVDVAEVCKCLAKFFTVLFFPLIETSVFKKDDFAVVQCCHFCVCIITNKVCCKGDLSGEMVCESVCNGLQCEFLCVVFQCFVKICLLCCCLFVGGECFHCLLFLLCETKAGGEDVVGFAHV